MPSKHDLNKVDSPWTDVKLDPNTYVQAVYTWFGLHTFWMKVYDKIPDNNALDFAERAKFGFKNSQHLTNAKESDVQFSAKTLEVFSRFSDIFSVI